MNIQLSPNFNLREFTRSSTATQQDITNEPPLAVIYKLQTLCQTVLQPIRYLWGGPIFVTSGYRSKQLNQAVGGATDSDHIYGCAADIRSRSDDKTTNKALFDLIVSMIKSGEIEVKQLIDEKNYDWIHISYQDGRTTKRNQILHIR